MTEKVSLHCYLASEEDATLRKAAEDIGCSRSSLVAVLAQHVELIVDELNDHEINLMQLARRRDAAQRARGAAVR